MGKPLPFEEKREPKRIRIDIRLVSSPEHYRCAKPAHRGGKSVDRSFFLLSKWRERERESAHLTEYAHFVRISAD